MAPRPVTSSIPASTPVTARSLGRDVLRAPRFRPLTHGVHLPASTQVSVGLRIRAVRLALGADAVLGGRTAAFALGAGLAGPDDPLEVVVAPDRRPRRRGLVVRRDALAPREVVSTALGPATSPARTAFDLGRRRPLGRAVEEVDAVLHRTGTTVRDLLEVAARHPGLRGTTTLRAVVPLVDPRAESPRESALRLLLVLSGLPPPTAQHDVVRRDGVFVGRLDLAWPLLRVGIEYDGDHHRDRRQHSRDLRRHNALRAEGWVVLQVDAAGLRRPDDLVVQVAGLLTARGW